MLSTFSEATRVKKVVAELKLQEEVVGKIAGSLSPPLQYHSGISHHGFRYAKPDWRNFCLLKAVRAVSGLNACVRLFGGGFSQEIAVIIRTIIECTTHIEFILSGLKGDQLGSEQAKYIDKFFSDFKRNEVADFEKPRIRQGDVHKAVGARTDELARSIDRSGSFENVESATLMSNVYLTYSNYVHCRYPEIMDLFGGVPGKFHLCGMRDIPKDEENLQQIETFVVTVSNALRFLVLNLGMRDEIIQHPAMSKWYPVPN